MPPSEQFTAAGKAILNSVYQICAEHEVPKSEIPDLLITLSEAVIIGQFESAPVTVNTTPDLRAKMTELHQQGLGYDEISKQTGLRRVTVARYLRHQ